MVGGVLRRVLALVIVLAATGCPHELNRTTTDLGLSPDTARLRDKGDPPVVDKGKEDQRPVDSLPADGSGKPDLGPCAGMGCTMGCLDAVKRCRRLNPTGMNTRLVHDQVTAKLVTSTADQVIINTNVGLITQGATILRPASQQGVVNGIYWNIVKQKAGYPDLSFFAFKSVSVIKGSSLSFTGLRVPAIYAAAGINIAGQVMLPVSYTTGGPGGYNGGGATGKAAAPCHGGGGTQGKGNDNWAYGGGGGGRKGKGGAGGYGGTNGGVGGAAKGAADLSPLYGGCGGGAGGGQTSGPLGVVGVGGRGGGGGGALQLASSTTITVSGTINAGGAGGGGASSMGGGGGGGSGGALLLEGGVITITGKVAANGGAGGGGASKTTKGLGGQPGLLDKKGASGGYGVGGGYGGTGGNYTSSNGASGKIGAPASGGGGGGVGHIRLNAYKLQLGSGLISPAPSLNNKLFTW